MDVLNQLDNKKKQFVMEKDKLTEDELVNIRGSLNLLCNRYTKRMRTEDYKAVETVKRFIDKLLGV